MTVSTDRASIEAVNSPRILKGVTIARRWMFTQHAIRKLIIGFGWPCFYTVEGNQPALQADIALALRALPPLAARSPPSDLPAAEMIGNGHGWIGACRLETASALAGNPVPFSSGVAQICRIACERIVFGKKTTDTIYTISSRTAEHRASAIGAEPG